MRIVAIIASYNEQRFIGACLEHLRSQGVQAYLIDNQSEDATVEIASRYLGDGLLGIETLPRDGVYRWRRILRRKEEVAAEMDADWFLHVDPDEILQPPREGTTLAGALGAVDASGFNAVDFAEFVFVPTQEAPDHDHVAFRSTMHWYYPFAPKPRHRVVAWKRQPARVDLASTGGHAVGFPEQQIYPERFQLRHYLFLSVAHAKEKYVDKRYDAEELGDRWHGWRATLRVDQIRLPRQNELRQARAAADLDPTSPRLLHCLEWGASAAKETPKSGRAAAGGGSSLPSVLCVVNRPDWAHDRKTQALERALAGRYRIVRRCQSEVTRDDLRRADLLLMYYWLQVEALGELAAELRQHRERLLIGICSHIELEGGWREPGLRLLSDLPGAVFANNRGLVDTFQPLLGRAVAYTPNGVDTQFFQPASRPARGGLRVGWAGSLTNHGPGHRGVHEVIAPAVAMVPGAELCLAAREERWRGPDEMLSFYQSLDVYVCASRSEGTPNPCLEAAACGLPIVTTRVGNMPELIRDGENGFFIERQPAQLAEKLCWLSEDRSLRRLMGEHARRAVAAWDWSLQARHYAELFDRVLAGDVARQIAG